MLPTTSSKCLPASQPILLLACRLRPRWALSVSTTLWHPVCPSALHVSVSCSATYQQNVYLCPVYHSVALSGSCSLCKVYTQIPVQSKCAIEPALSISTLCICFNVHDEHGIAHASDQMYDQNALYCCLATCCMLIKPLQYAAHQMSADTEKCCLAHCCMHHRRRQADSDHMFVQLSIACSKRCSM